MRVPEITIQPDYVSNFSCITSDCEDTCCCGWQVVVDKDTFDKYQNFPVAGMQALIDHTFRHKPKSAVAQDYAEVNLGDAGCPFLTKERLCKIQRACGEDFLSVTCLNFPRNYNIVNGILERSLNLSCPEAARVALLDDGKMQFSRKAVNPGLRIGEVPVLDCADGQYADSQYPHFEDIREFTIALLQNREYALEDRLLILGRFCLELQLLATTPGSAQTADLIGLYTQKVADGEFAEFLALVPDEPASLLKTVVTLLEYRMKTEAAGLRFTECYEQFRLGLQYTNYIADKELARSYAAAKAQYYDVFMGEHGYILENYFVNYVFRTLFPLGPQKCAYQKSIYMKPKSIFAAYVLLVIHFAMIKNLLVGMSAYWEKEFGTEHVLKLIQSFCKNIDHDCPYQEQLLQFFEKNNMMNFPCAAMLLKN